MKGAGGGSYAVPCSDPAILVGELKEAVVKRMCSESDGCSPEDYRLILVGTESIISDKDVVGEVLRDGDCLILQGMLQLLLGTVNLNRLHSSNLPHGCVQKLGTAMIYWAIPLGDSFLSYLVGTSGMPEFSANCCGGGLTNLYGGDSTNLPTYTLYPTQYFLSCSFQMYLNET